MLRSPRFNFLSAIGRGEPYSVVHSYGGFPADRHVAYFTVRRRLHVPFEMELQRFSLQSRHQVQSRQWHSKSSSSVRLVTSILVGLSAGCSPSDASLVAPAPAESLFGKGAPKPGGGIAAVNLRTAGNFVILSKSGISTTGTTSITGNIGVSPIAATAITGFGLILDRSNTFSRSTLVTGKVYAASYAAPTPTMLTAAVGDMQTAYEDAAGRTLPTYVELGAGNIGGLTLSPGLYKWSTAVTIPTNVTLNGSSSDVWIFQIAQTLDISSGKQVILRGGASAKNIFWQVAGQTTLGTTSVFNGVILGATAIVMQTGARLNGKALAQTAVTLDANTVK